MLQFIGIIGSGLLQSGSKNSNSSDLQSFLSMSQILLCVGLSNSIAAVNDLVQVFD